MKGLVRNKKTRNPLLNAKPAKVTWTSPKQTSVLKTHWSTEKGANSKRDGNAIFRQERTPAELAEELEKEIQKQYEGLDLTIQQLFDSEEGSEKYNESIRVAPLILDELKKLLPNETDFIFRSLGLEGLSGDRLAKVNETDLTEIFLANKLFEPDPRFKRLLNEVLAGNQAFYYFPIHDENKNEWKWEYEKISKTDLIEKFVQSWKASVLQDSVLWNTKEYQEYHGQLPKDKNGNRGLLPRHVKKPVDMAMLEVLKEFRTWGLNPIPLLALLPNIQFGHIDTKNQTGLENILNVIKSKKKMVDEYAYTIPPGTTDEPDVVWPYFRVAFRKQGPKEGETGLTALFKICNDYSFYTTGTGQQIRRDRKNSKLQFRALEENIIQNNTNKIKAILEAIQYKKIRLVKASDFYINKEIYFMVRSVPKIDEPGYYVEFSEISREYTIPMLQNSVITLIHELLHVFSLSGCNAVVKDKTHFTPDENFHDEAFVHLLDRVIELIAIISQMEKQEQKGSNYEEIKETLRTKLCAFYEKARSIYEENKIYPCLELLKLPNREEEINPRPR